MKLDNTVAPITLMFWIAKIWATTLGETAGDLLSMTLQLGYVLTSGLLLGLLLVALRWQFKARRFMPWRFWLVVLLTSMAGTTVSDCLDRSLGLGYATGASVLAIALGAVLLLWWAAEGNLAVGRIHTPRQQSFYWAAILCSNTLGTALGDYLADDSGLGFAGGALLIATLIAGIAAAYRYTCVSHVLLFWLAFVLTRPFGATFGDLLTKPADGGGLALGTAGASVVLLCLLCVTMRLTSRDTRPSRAG